MADVTSTPKTTMLSRLYYSTTLSGEKTQIAWVQSIPQFNPAPESITYSALDTDYEGQEPGRRKADALEIPVLYTHEQNSTLKALDEDTEYYWFVLLPEATNPDGSPECFYFQGKMRLGLDEMAIDDMIQETITIYKSTAVTEVEGLPASA